MSSTWTKASKVGQAYLWSILIWLGLSPLLAAEDKVRLLDRGQDTAYWTLLMVNGVWLFTLALLTPPIFAIVSRHSVAKPNGLTRIGGYVLGSAPFVVAAACIRWALLPPWDSLNQRFAHRTLSGLVHSTFIFAELTVEYFLIVAAAHAYYYFLRARDQELESAELERALAATELQALKSQLHPHFLFNTLHGISALIDIDKARAKAMILKVSSLLRTALQYSSTDLVTLDEELKFVEDYFDLERMRLENRLRLRWEIRPETRHFLIPQLILQPLVENAILHGIACCREGGWIEVTSRSSEGLVEIQIRNSVNGKQQGGMGLGLRNTRTRLKCLYSDEAAFSFDLTDDGIATAKLVLPALASQTQAREEAPISSLNA